MSTSRPQRSSRRITRRSSKSDHKGQTKKIYQKKNKNEIEWRTDDKNDATEKERHWRATAELGNHVGRSTDRSTPQPQPLPLLHSSAPSSAVSAVPVLRAPSSHHPHLPPVLLCRVYFHSSSPPTRCRAAPPPSTPTSAQPHALFCGVFLLFVSLLVRPSLCIHPHWRMLPWSLARTVSWKEIPLISCANVDWIISLFFVEAAQSQRLQHARVQATPLLVTNCKLRRLEIERNG